MGMFEDKRDKIVLGVCGDATLQLGTARSAAAEGCCVLAITSIDTSVGYVQSLYGGVLVQTKCTDILLIK